MAGEHFVKRATAAPRLGLPAIGFLIVLVVIYLIFSGFLSSCSPPDGSAAFEVQRGVPDGLEFMSNKNVLLVSHELSLTGGPLLLMELAILLRFAHADVQWITNQRDPSTSEVAKQLESKLTENAVKILLPKGQEAVEAAKRADIIVLNTAVAGKWIDSSLKSEISQALPKTLWWIHEMRGHYFTMDYVKHLPNVAAAMIDSHATADYWQNRTKERLGITMPKTYVVHLGNSKELTMAAENPLARHLLRQHIRESLHIAKNDVVFAAINSVSRGKGQDLFLKAFNEVLEIIDTRQHIQHLNYHIQAVIVGSDLNGQPKFEKELRDFVLRKGISEYVHFVNKTMNVIPYLAAADVLVQNSQARGECFGRITIEAMAFRLPILGTAAGGTEEIVEDGKSGYLHPLGKGGVKLLSANIMKMFLSKEVRMRMGGNGYERVRNNFMEHHMSRRIGNVLKHILQHR